MSTLHIFNPSHDEALAANSPYYYPTRAARTLANDLGTLPTWWAQEGDFVLLPKDVTLPNNDFSHRGIHYVHLADVKKEIASNITSVAPWGWDALLLHQLQQTSLSPNLLPTENELKTIRQLSSRNTAVQLLKAVRKELPTTVGESFLATEEGQVAELIEHYGSIMLKAPWSCSGRGVFSADGQSPEGVRLRVARILREQGAIEVEPFYERIADFALEYEATTNGLIYKGLSVFATTAIGAYAGNIVAEDHVLLKQIPEEIREVLAQATISLGKHLQEILKGKYTGPLGIDLMCVKDKDRLALHPCVEVNMRNTMGQVALELRNMVSPGQTGIYRLQTIAEHSSDTLCLTPHARQMEAVLCIPHTNQ